MKYAIYDKAAEGYLTKMEFDGEIPDNKKYVYLIPNTDTELSCGYNEYITEDQLLSTKEDADDIIVRIESFKFMEKGRFVVHSFDDTLLDEYIISEAEKPTKVVDSITVDLDGRINIKYGTMLTHWSATSLEYAINRLNALQKAASPLYSSWRNTFDVYKVITVIDERSCTHYQFINVTAKGLEECPNKEEENDNLKSKVDSIKNEAHTWGTLYKEADSDRDELKNAIDTIHINLRSVINQIDNLTK